ncbi:flavodoxin domain-containing protein [Streptomyces sp. Je 1-369]|uniref:flavodoxin domain-containing protein n=1 Tax=Streptomyces sp. Je 1-369 TaxID=2966192 RepID=UPI0022861ACC|nr:flavodoxin domain-containing protein [Streptomyces sp. Je 1-369]WAL99645.1 flavodoxin [Streptomyces sp. Je 1-369]
MLSKVLVAYGTTNGSTARIAEAIADVLRRNGLDADALPAGSVADVDSYDAVVLGGALYADRWHKDARRFARRHRRALATRPLWLFSSGPLDAAAAQHEIPPVRGAKAVLFRFDAEEHRTFGGCLEEGAKGFIARKIVAAGKGGDFRDFAQIEAWAQRIADAVSGIRPAVSSEERTERG